MTVAEVDALLYLPGHSRQQLAQALRIPALPDGWKASFRAMLDQPGSAGGTAGNAGLTAVSPAPAWPGFRPMAVTALERETESVLSVLLADPDGAAVPPARPGQFLTLRLPVSPGGQPLLRSYSLSGPPGASSYRISVKREPHGAASQFIHARVRAGDQLEVAAPRGTFILQPGTAPVVLISAGVGATPVLAMLHDLAAARSGRDIWWLHGARSRAEEPFAAQSRSLLAELASGHRYISYSHPGPGDVRGRDYQALGRLSPDVLAALDLPRDADAYLCGPAAFMAQLSAALTGLGIDRARVHTEIFGAAGSQTPGIAPAAARPSHQPAGPPGTGPDIAFARSGLTVRWDQRYASLLELAEASDVPVRWSCRTGVCHTCETALLSGTVGYAPEPVDAARRRQRADLLFPAPRRPRTRPVSPPALAARHAGAGAGRIRSARALAVTRPAPPSVPRCPADTLDDDLWQLPGAGLAHCGFVMMPSVCHYGTHGFAAVHR